MGFVSTLQDVMLKAGITSPVKSMIKLYVPALIDLPLAWLIDQPVLFRHGILITQDDMEMTRSPGDLMPSLQR